MAISKVWIEEGCTSCGLCENTCPAVFEVLDATAIVKSAGVNFKDYEEEIIQCAEECPVEIIKYS